MKAKKKKLTADYLKKLKVPKVVMIGLLIAASLGWAGYDKLKDVKNYYEMKEIFPVKTKAVEVLDGDTFVMENGLTLRLLGIDAPNRGADRYQEAGDYLRSLLFEKELVIEYDAPQDDKFGRVLGYVFIPCRQDLKNYCRDNKILINEVMIKQGYAKFVAYSSRKKLKYEPYLSGN